MVRHRFGLIFRHKLVLADGLPRSSPIRGSTEPPHGGAHPQQSYRNHGLPASAHESTCGMHLHKHIRRSSCTRKLKLGARSCEHSPTPCSQPLVFLLVFVLCCCPSCFQFGLLPLWACVPCPGWFCSVVHCRSCPLLFLAIVVHVLVCVCPESFCPVLPFYFGHR